LFRDDPGSKLPPGWEIIQWRLRGYLIFRSVSFCGTMAEIVIDYLVGLEVSNTCGRLYCVFGPDVVLKAIVQLVCELLLEPL
jgi:hypothetical protein